jgi:hypothetical protein
VKSYHNWRKNAPKNPEISGTAINPSPGLEILEKGALPVMDVLGNF